MSNEVEEIKSYIRFLGIRGKSAGTQRPEADLDRETAEKLLNDIEDDLHKKEAYQR